ncbi:MAG: N-6 DNA methylase [Spirochaetaceae bacterium]|jgi:predicted helicase|nr:N-6 DNA methylase [Spirochaetaceae bacterium]
MEEQPADSGKRIYKADRLAKSMAASAKLLAEVIKTVITESQNDALSGQYEAFKKIHNLEISEFADLYAQTLAYGFFAARLNQRDKRTFTRYLAPQEIPQSNSFLRIFFQYIAGFDLDPRVARIADAMADLFNRVDVGAIKEAFEKSARDPYIHFYETFLAEYDPKLRETRGVYYTPIPAARFIVQAADDILKTDFGFKEGLADNSRIRKDGAGKTKPHRVQILDPAAGTGTFLAETIEKVFSSFRDDKNRWPDYCAEHLIPRLQGFEILTASYTMAHLKLEMKLKETGFSFKDDGPENLRIFLTNSLEKPENTELKVPGLSQEEAWDAPVLIILGNPPYNVSTQNRGEWIDGLIADYKKDLNEKKINLDDDYIKFIRYGQYLIEKNSLGLLAYISNNSFIDGVTHRTLRKTLLETFDSVYILDLHGNSRKKEGSPDGGKDENVFDIMQGVSINIFIKTNREKRKCKIYHHDVYGTRKTKYKFLHENTLKSITWRVLKPEMPYFFFSPKNFSHEKEYKKGFSVTELFTQYSSGITTCKDTIAISFTKKESDQIKQDFTSLDKQALTEKYKITDARDWRIEWVKQDMLTNTILARKINYRPFDIRYINYTGITKGLMAYPRHEVMRHFLSEDNIGLVTCRNQNYKTAGFITGSLCDMRYYSNPGSIGGDYVFPLYLYSDKDSFTEGQKRSPNLNADIVQTIAEKTGLLFTSEKQIFSENIFTPIDIFDYLYAILYSGIYRRQYAEFLKIDFPRVPYPVCAPEFRALTELGAALRRAHLLRGANQTEGLADFPIQGANIIETIAYKNGNVYINKTQRFENLPLKVWEYRIGGYQPAQKWLKDRKTKKLSFDDIQHYQKIASALKQTILIQTRIDACRQLKAQGKI